jgi:N6-adenosine-specific RNA methylase IME4
MTGTADIRVADIVVPRDRMRRLRPEVVEELAASIAAQGLLQPIVLRPRGPANYWLVAGHHRLEAVRKCGHDCIRAVILDGLDADRALLAEIDENLIRADLSPAERALHIGRRKELYEKAHPETKHGAVGRRGKSSKNENSYVEDTAAWTGKGRSTIARDATRANKVVVLADIVGTSLDQGEEIDALAKLPENEQRKLAERVKTGEKVTAKHVAQRLQRESRERELAEATEAASAALGKKLYGVILADPPWSFKIYNADSGLDSAADAHYPCMETAKIAALPVPAADNCVLFLWSTAPHLPEALEVMRAWGFEYRTNVVWKKDRTGLGYWFRNQHEHLLVGVRGDVPTPAPTQRSSSVIEAPRTGHSVKPAAVAEMIERMFPSMPRLEMFARTVRKNRDAWGNEAPGDDTDDLRIPAFLDRTKESVS